LNNNPIEYITEEAIKELEKYSILFRNEILAHAILIAIEEGVIECKHWLRTRISSNITHIVEHHLARMISFKDIAQKVFTQLTPNKSEIILIPVIIVPPKNIPEIVSGIPVVTLYKLQDFINRFEDYIDEIKHVRIMLSRL